MRALVTGGAGFIGKHLVGRLLSDGHEVTVLDNLHRSERISVPSGATFLAGDIRSRESVVAAVERQDVVFHLAAQSNVLGAMNDIDYSFETNVVGTFNVLSAAHAAGVRRVVFASSREVYGEPADLPVREDVPLLAKNPYGASKVAGEAYCRAWTAFGGLEAAVLRFANVYGPGDSGRVIPSWISRAVEGQALHLYGGSQVLDFVPVEFAVTALVRAAEAPVSEPINVGSGRGTTLIALAERIRGLTGYRSGVQVEPARSSEVVRFVADVSRLRAELNLEAPVDPLGDLEALVHRALTPTTTRR